MATSIIKTNELRLLNDQVVMSDGALTGNVMFPAGHIVQTVYTSDNTRRLFSGLASHTWYDNYTALNLSITPKFSNSLLYVMCNVMFYCNGDSNTNVGSGFLRMMINGSISPELNGDTTEKHPCFAQARSFGGNVTASIYDTRVGICQGYVQISDKTEKMFSIEYRCQDGGRVSFNRDPSTASDTNQGSHSPTGRSTFTVMEIAQ